MENTMTTNTVETKRQYQGIEGWLILPLLGIIISIIQEFYYFFKAILPVFISGDVYYIFFPEVSYSDTTYLQVATFSLFCMITVIGLSLYTLFLFWKFCIKSKSTPTLYIIWLVSSIVVLAVMLTMMCVLPAVTELYDGKEFKEHIRELGRSVLSATIWIPYFMVSQRVKKTFVR